MGTHDIDGDYTADESVATNKPSNQKMFCLQGPPESRAELKGTHYMGQTGFCENLRFPAIFCENLRFPAVFCKNLRLRNALFNSQEKRKSAKICEKLRMWLRLSLLVCPFEFPLRVPHPMACNTNFHLVGQIELSQKRFFAKGFL